MKNWQQYALRADPFPDIPFGAVGMNIDAQVGLACIAAVVLVWLCGG